MQKYTLDDLTNNVWYMQKLLVKDIDENILFEGDNHTLRRGYEYKSFMDRWIKSIGIIDDTLIITII